MLLWHLKIWHKKKKSDHILKSRNDIQTTQNSIAIVVFSGRSLGWASAPLFPLSLMSDTLPYGTTQVVLLKGGDCVLTPPEISAGCRGCTGPGRGQAVCWQHVTASSETQVLAALENSAFLWLKCLSFATLCTAIKAWLHVALQRC